MGRAGDPRSRSGPADSPLRHLLAEGRRGSTTGVTAASPRARPRGRAGRRCGSDVGLRSPARAGGRLGRPAAVRSPSAQAAPAASPGSIRGRVEVQREVAVGEARPAVAELGHGRAPRTRRTAGAASSTWRRRPRGVRGRRRPGGPCLDQRNETFVPYVLAVTVGTTVDFPNSDRDLPQRVLALEAEALRPRPLPARPVASSVRFDQPGVVRVFCEIHSHMSAFILVFAHRYFATTDAEGRYRIDGVPPGHLHARGLERRRACARRGRCDVPDGRRRRRRWTSRSSDGALLSSRCRTACSWPPRSSRSCRSAVALQFVTAPRDRGGRGGAGARPRRGGATLVEQHHAARLETLTRRWPGSWPTCPSSRRRSRPATRRTVEPVARDYRAAGQVRRLRGDRPRRAASWSPWVRRRGGAEERRSRPPSPRAETTAFGVDGGRLLEVVTVPIVLGSAPPEVLGHAEPRLRPRRRPRGPVQAR